jgi:hypothetical protein
MRTPQSEFADMLLTLRNEFERWETDGWPFRRGDEITIRMEVSRKHESAGVTIRRTVGKS